MRNDTFAPSIVRLMTKTTTNLVFVLLCSLVSAQEISSTAIDNSVAYANINSYGNDFNHYIPESTEKELFAPKKYAEIILMNLHHVYNGQQKQATVMTFPTGVKTRVEYNGSETAPSQPGTYIVEAFIIDAEYEENSILDVLQIDKPGSDSEIQDDVIVYFDQSRDLLLVKTESNSDVKLIDPMDIVVQESAGLILRNMSTKGLVPGEYVVQVFVDGKTIERNITLK